jgi:chromosome segregation ATPase
LNEKEDDSSEIIDKLQLVNQEIYEKVQELEKTIKMHLDQIQFLETQHQNQSTEFTKILSSKDLLLNSESESKQQTFDRLKTLQEQNMTLNDQVEDHEFKLTTLQSEFDKVKEELKTREESNVEITEIVNELETTTKVLKTDLGVTTKSLETAESALAKAHKDLEKSLLKCIDLEAQFSDAAVTHQSKIKTLKTEISDQKAKLTSQEAEIQITKIDLSVKDEPMERMKEATKELTERLTLLQKDLDSKIEELELALQEKIHVEVKSEEIQLKYKNLQEEFEMKDEKLIEAEKENVVVRQERSEYLKKGVIHATVLKATQGHNTQLNSEVMKLKDENKMLRTTLEARDKKIQTQDQLKKQFSDTFEGMTVAIKTLNNQNKSFSSQNCHLQANAYQLAETIVKHEKVNLVLLQENENALSQSKSVQEDLDALKQMTNEKDAEIKKLKKKYRVSI